MLWVEWAAPDEPVHKYILEWCVLSEKAPCVPDWQQEAGTARRTYLTGNLPDVSGTRSSLFRRALLHVPFCFTGFAVHQKAFGLSLSLVRCLTHRCSYSELQGLWTDKWATLSSSCAPVFSSSHEQSQNCKARENIRDQTSAN